MTAMRFTGAILVASLALGACKDKDPGPAKGAASKEQKTPAKAAGAEDKAAKPEATAADAKAAAQELPPPDPKGLASVPKILEAAPPEPMARVRVAAAVLKGLEADRIPKELVKALEAIDQVDPDQMTEAIAMGILADAPGPSGSAAQHAGHQAFLDICKDGDRIFETLASMPPDARMVAMWNACKFGDSTLLAEDEARAAPNFLLPVLALTIHGYLKARTELHPAERQALRTLATGK